MNGLPPQHEIKIKRETLVSFRNLLVEDKKEMSDGEPEHPGLQYAIEFLEEVAEGLAKDLTDLPVCGYDRCTKQALHEGDCI